MRKQDQAKQRGAGYLTFCITAWALALMHNRAEAFFVVVFSTIAGVLAAFAMEMYHKYLDHLADHLPERVKARRAEAGLDIVSN